MSGERPGVVEALLAMGFPPCRVAAAAEARDTPEAALEWLLERPEAPERPAARRGDARPAEAVVVDEGEGPAAKRRRREKGPAIDAESAAALMRSLEAPPEPSSSSAAPARLARRGSLLMSEAPRRV